MIIFRLEFSFGDCYEVYLHSFLAHMKKVYIVLLTIASQLVYAQSKTESAKWNVEKPAGPTRTISFTTDEGTWMNLDVSPNGKESVFDLLGDIYKMPLS